MSELKPLSREAIARSIKKAEHYRLLNQPHVAESICLDVLEVDQDNQEALVALILALTDQFSMTTAPGAGGMNRALDLITQLDDAYARMYYTGIIYERQATAKLNLSYPEAGYDAYDLLLEAMDWFEKAEAIEPAGSDDAILRWNTCVRTIEQHHLRERPQDDFKPYLE